MCAAAAALGCDPVARDRPSDFAQALFDLGAGLCTPTSPACGICPWTDVCEARRLGIADQLPIKAPRKSRPVRYGVHFWLTDEAGNVLLRRRPERGLLGGMTELPGTPWRAETWSEAEALTHAPMAADWRRAGQVQHGFTHFELFIDLFAATVPVLVNDGFQHAIADLGQLALPSAMQKCVLRAQGKVAEK
jgi:A/G-specific adenine glycosylase